MSLIGTIAINVSATTKKLRIGIQKARTMLGRLGQAATLNGRLITAGMKAASVATAILGKVGRGAMVGLAATSSLAAGSVQLLGRAATIALGPIVTLARTLGPLVLAAGVASTVVGIEKLNRELNAVAAVSGGLAAGEMEQLKKAAISVGRITKFSGVEAAQGLRFLKAAGLDTQDAITTLPVAAKFAQAAMIDMGDATQRLVVTMKSMGLEASTSQAKLASMTRVADVLAKGASLAATSVSDVSDALNAVSGTARVSGLSLEATVAAIIALQEQGEAGVKAGVVLGQMLDNMTAKAVANEKAFEELGIEVFRFGEQRAIVDVMKDLEAALGDLDDRARQVALDRIGIPIKAIRGFKKLLGASGTMEEFQQKIENAGGAMEKMADTQLTPLQAGWADLKAAIESAAEPLITPFLARIGEELTRTAKLLRFFANNWRTMWELAQVEVEIALNSVKAGFVGVMAGAAALTTGVMKNWSAIWKDIQAVSIAGVTAVLATFDELAKQSENIFEQIGIRVAEALGADIPEAAKKTIIDFDAIGQAATDAFTQSMAKSGTGGGVEKTGREIASAFVAGYVGEIDDSLKSRRSELQASLAAGMKQPVKDVAKAAAMTLGTGIGTAVGELLAGALNAVASKSIKKVGKQLKQVDPGGAGAALKGSQEAIASIARQERGPDRDAIKKNTGETAKNTKDTVGLLSKMQSGAQIAQIISVRF